MSQQERSDWRDQAFSHRHRDWGFDCPAVDIDFLMLEYDEGKPIALVEYKCFPAGPGDIDKNSSYRAMKNLVNGNKCGPIPFFVACYWPEIWAFRIHPMNNAARHVFATPEALTEREYVTKLYEMRGRTIPFDIRRSLNKHKPPKDKRPRKKKKVCLKP